jgi:DNA-binding SARP family transcriptional activator
MATGAAGLQFHVLRPLTVFRGDERLDLGPSRQRAVLALLLISPNEVVSVDRLVDQLWTDPPPAALGTLHTYISHLRRSLEPARPTRAAPTVLVSEPPGYRLNVERHALDALVFDDRFTASRTAAERGEWAAALDMIDAALACWSGVPLADFEHDDFTQSWRARLEERRAAAEETRIDALVQVGRNLDAVADLEALVTKWPLRERFRSQQVLALARAGRQADALRAYDRARTQLLDELGIDPGPELEAAYRRVLEQSEDLYAPREPVAVVPAPPRTQSRGFVGRLGLVDEILEDSRPKFVIITGEPGVGKTRLAEEVISAGKRGGALVAFGRCHDDDGAPPLWPWRQVLRDLALDDPAMETANSSDLFAQFEGIR